LAKERFSSVWQTNNHQKFDHTTINLCTDYFTFARNDIEKKILNFFWDDKPAKIKKTILFKEKTEGGLNLTKQKCVGIMECYAEPIVVNNDVLS
jgi:hypothetical protein